jgi:nitrogen regulatory protein PII
MEQTERIALAMERTTVAYDLLPRVKFEIVIPDEHLDRVVQTIIESARTGESGDGVVFVTTIEQAINISTLDKGDSAILQQDIKSREENSTSKSIRKEI